MNIKGLHVKNAIVHGSGRGPNPHLPIIQVRWTDEPVTAWKNQANAVLNCHVTMEDVLVEIKRSWAACRAHYNLRHDAEFRVVYPETYPESPQASLDWETALQTPFSNSIKLDCGHPIQASGRVREGDESEEPHCLWCGDITDMAVLVNNLSAVYFYMSGGHVSKPMTLPSVVISLSDEREERAIADAVAEATSEMTNDLTDAVAILRELDTAGCACINFDVGLAAKRVDLLGKYPCPSA